MAIDYTYVLAGEQNVGNGTTPPAAGTRQGTQLVDGLHGKYVEQARRQRIFWASAIVTAPVIFSTAAGTGGPLLYNGSSATSGVMCAILGISLNQSVVTTVAAGIGLTGGPTTAPTSTTAIDGLTNGYIGAAAGQVSAYRIGTPSAAGTFFMPLADFHTGALTTEAGNGGSWIDIGGAIIIPPGGYFASLAASATASTLVMRATILYEEIPV